MTTKKKTKKKTSKRVKRGRTTAEVLARLCDALTATYSGDSCAPGVVIAKVKVKPRNLDEMVLNGGGFEGREQYYVSICRYKNGHADKRVLHKAYADELHDAVTTVARAWMGETAEKLALKEVL